MDMGTQGSGRKRLPNRERLTAEDDALSQIAREAEARLAAKRAARAEAREIRMKELERQQKEIYQVQKKYYGLDTKWGDIEQWMEDSERCYRRSRRNTSASDEDERVSVGSRGSLRSQPDLEFGGPYAWTNGFDGDLHGSQSLSRRAGRPSEYGSHFSSGPCSSSGASSARASPVVEERPEKDFTEKGSRNMPGLSAATLASLGGTSSRRGSGDTSVSMDTEASIREIKELNELKDQIQDVEGKYMQGLKEMKDSLAEVEEKYKKAMVSNAQLDNEKTNFMYQVDTLKDTLLDLEEQLAESRRQYEEKNKEFEREKHAHSVLQFQFAEVKEALRQREEMLEEIRQLQQKQQSYIREISDLQETIEWKDKKIGALERQKEFFDSIRSERDDLREEIVKLKEELKKHGIILNSDIATNGETPDTLNHVGCPDPTTMTKQELSALKSAGDGGLGRTSEVEVRSEIVEAVGKRESLQSAEPEQHKVRAGEHCADAEASDPGESAEDRKRSQDRAGAACERVQSPVLEDTASLENPGRVESNEAIAVAAGKIRASPEQPGSSGGLDSEDPGPRSGQGASDTKSQGEQSVGKQEQGNPEDLKTDLEKVSPTPHQECAPEVETVTRAEARGPSGGSTGSAREAGGAAVRGRGDPTAASPPEHSSGEESPRRAPAVDALGPSAAQSSEGELPSQEAAEPGEVPGPSTDAGGEKGAGDGGDAEVRGGEPVQVALQTAPGSPAATESHQEAPGPGRADSAGEPPGAKEASEEKHDQQAEALDSSQKKTKNKKKKNKKKKTPAPVESLKDVKKELTYQDTDADRVKQEEQVQNPTQKAGAGSRECADCPETPETKLDGKPNCEDAGVKTEAGRATPDGDTLTFEDATVPSSGPSASDKELDEGVAKDSAGTDQGAQSRPLGPEPGDGDSSAPLESRRPPEDGGSAAQAESTQGHPCHPSQAAEAASGGLSLGHSGLSTAARESGDFSPESGDLAGAGNEKGKSKEDCTMS